jgi:RNA polymerase sigma-70 factor (ECF subfamily)
MMPAAGGRVAADAAVVRAAATGDVRAFEMLYERYGRMVRGILLARVRRDDVSDLLQDVFLSAWTRLPTLRDPAAFGGWLATIARNRATDFARRVHEEIELENAERLQDGQSIERRADPYGLDAGTALDAIRSLPLAYRETLVLRLVEGLTGPEIAARTGITPGSVRVNLHRGMKLLRDALRVTARAERSERRSASE